MGIEPVKGLIHAVMDGDPLQMFEQLRIELAKQIQLTDSGRDKAALSKQFVDVTEKIEQIKKNRPDENRRTPLDEIRSKRQKKASPTKRKPNT